MDYLCFIVVRVDYKDVDEVARVCQAAGLAARVARLRPLGVIKA